jgi:hypothetical protein
MDHELVAVRFYLPLVLALRYGEEIEYIMDCFGLGIGQSYTTRLHLSVNLFCLDVGVIRLAFRYDNSCGVGDNRR